MKNCPFCAEEIKNAALKCKHCGEWFKQFVLYDKKINIGQKLRFSRQKRRITLKEMSELTGVQIATLSRMENNKTLGNLKNYLSIAKSLRLKLCELFAEMDM